MIAILHLSVLLFAALATAQKEKDELSNLRPINVTGLSYYLYRWTGSYYNGTTKISIDPQDFIEDSDCDTRWGGPIEVTYENSLLAIVKSNRHIKEQNELTFALKFWDKSLNMTPIRDDADGPINDIQTIESCELNRYDTPIGTTPAPWKFNTTNSFDSSYSFFGYRNYSASPEHLLLNYTQCESSSLAEYGGLIPEPDPDGGIDFLGINVTTFPTVTGSFDNSSASLQIRGMFRANFLTGQKGRMSYIGGPITISFLGRLDADRSDELMPSTNGTPVWRETLGYEKMLFESAGAWNGVGWTWVYGVAMLGVAVWVL